MYMYRGASPASLKAGPGGDACFKVSTPPSPLPQVMTAPLSSFFQ